MRNRLRGVTAILVPVLAFGWVGCDGDPVEEGPRTGWWDYTDEGILQNTCGTEDVFTDPDTTFWLTNHLDDSFTIEQGTAGPFDCTHNGLTFDCPERLAGDHPIQGYDATLHYTAEVNGSLLSRDSLRGEQRFDVTCQGNDCAALAAAWGVTVPCYYRVAFSAAHH